MSSTLTQADTRINDDQLLNFLVQTLDETIDLDLGDNAEFEPADLFEVLVGATA
ncbi:MAG: ISH3 family transposase, partial [Halobacteriaceae archaeon]